MSIFNKTVSVITFNKLPVIQVRGDICQLKVNSITADSSSGSNDYINHTFIIKLNNVKYNHNYYFT